MTIRPDALRITLPPRMSQRALEKFLLDNRDWLHRLTNEYASKQLPLLPDVLTAGTPIPFLGRNWPLRIVERKMYKRSHVIFEHGFYVHMPAGLKEPERSYEIKRVLKRWMKEKLRARADELCQKYVKVLGRRPAAIRMKTMTSRWGSCGSTDIININWLLAFAPQECFDYVVAHEAAHLRYRDHSKRFWNCVANIMPGYEAPREWLQTEGKYLRDIFA